MLVCIVAVSIGTLCVGIVTLERTDSIASDVSPGSVELIKCDIDWVNAKFIDPSGPDGAPQKPEEIPIFLYNQKFYANAALTAATKKTLHSCDLYFYNSIVNKAGMTRVKDPTTLDQTKVAYLVSDEVLDQRRQLSLLGFLSKKKDTFGNTQAGGTYSSTRTKTEKGTCSYVTKLVTTTLDSLTSLSITPACEDAVKTSTITSGVYVQRSKSTESSGSATVVESTD